MEKRIEFRFRYSKGLAFAHRAGAHLRDTLKIPYNLGDDEGYWVVDDLFVRQVGRQDLPRIAIPHLLGEDMRRRFADYALDRGTSESAEFVVEVKVGGQWVTAPTTDELSYPTWSAFIPPEKDGASSASDDSEDSEKSDDDEEEEEDREDLITCPNCGCDSDDTTFQALVYVTETRTATIRQTRRVRAWADVDRVDHNTDAHVGCVNEVHHDDEDDDWEDEEELDYESSDFEIDESCEEVLKCPECDHEFDAPGSVLT